jgi:RNA polymerase sigma-70 factor (ECF subfamily)
VAAEARREELKAMDSDPELQSRVSRLSEHRAFLLRLAQLQLGSTADADDVVQETLLAALGAIQRFADRASVRTWLTGILRHKIVDALRARKRQVAMKEEPEPPGDAEFDWMFDENDRWRSDTLSSWASPESATAQEQFLAVLEACLERLPASTARVFMMREYLDMDVAEVSTTLRLSAGNIRVQLYRARMRLRGCVNRNWLERDQSCATLDTSS